MIGTTGAAILVIANIILARVLGICAGGVTCAVLRRLWSFKAVGIDAVFAMVVAVTAAYVLTTINVSRGDVLHSVVAEVWVIAALSVVARHLLLALLSAKSRTS